MTDFQICYNYKPFLKYLKYPRKYIIKIKIYK